VSRRLIAIVIAWPLAYFVYSQILGAISGWYPYPFLDADEHGTGGVLVNAAVVTVLVVGLAVVFLVTDRRLAERTDRRAAQPSPERAN
jgi:choline-glycine betaine transporter